MLKKQHSANIPLFMFQHPYLSIPSRVLLAYSYFMNEEGQAWPSTRNVAILCGLVGEDSEPTDADLKAVKNARASLKRGCKIREGEVLSDLLTHERVSKKGETSRDRYTLRIFPLKPGALQTWNEVNGKDFQKEDRWAASEGEDGFRFNPDLDLGI